MTATTFACSTVASSSANSAAHRYDPGARPSSSNWTDYVVSLYDPTVDNENQEPEPEICLILGDAAASLERGPKDATTQRFTDVSATVPRKECDSTGGVDSGILKLGAEVLGVPRPVPNRPSPDGSCGSDDPNPTGTMSVEEREGDEAAGPAEEGDALSQPGSPPRLVPRLAVVVPPPLARGADPQSFSLFGAFGSDAGSSCGGLELLRSGDDELLQDKLLQDELRRIELSQPLGSPDTQEPEPAPWVQQGGSDPSLVSEARGQSTPGHRRSNSDPPSTIAAANFNIWGACSGSRVWAHDVGSPSKSWAGPSASGPVAAAAVPPAPPDPDEALAQHLRFAAATAAAADAAPCGGSRGALSECTSGPVLSAGRMGPSGVAAGPPRPMSCGDASSRPPSGGAYRPPSGSTRSDSRPPSGGSGCSSVFSATCAPAAPPTIIGGSLDLQAKLDLQAQQQQQQAQQLQAQQQQLQAQQQQVQAQAQAQAQAQLDLQAQQQQQQQQQLQVQQQALQAQQQQQQLQAQQQAQQQQLQAQQQAQLQAQQRQLQHSQHQPTVPTPTAPRMAAAMPAASTYSAGLAYQQTSRAAPPLIECRPHNCAPPAGGYPGQPYQGGAAPPYAGLRGGAHLPPRPAPFDACRTSEAYTGDARQAKELAMSPKTRAVYKDFSHKLRSKDTQSKGMRHAQDLAQRCMAELPEVTPTPTPTPTPTLT